MGETGEKCNACEKDQAQCACQPRTQPKLLYTGLKPPDLFVKKEDLPQYERKLRRWSRACGIDIKDQGDIVLLHQSQTNPNLHDRLDREIGDKVQGNAESINLIITTLKSWFGVDKGVDLMKIFNDFVNTQRSQSQDLHSYVADFEGKYNQLEKHGEKLSPRLLALFILKNANLSDTEFQIITANLDFSSEKEADVKKLYDNTKDALNKHQNCRVINASSCQGHAKTFLVDPASLESLSEEQQEELVLWLKRKRFGEKSSSEDPPVKKWRKCQHCMCDCQPKWKKCDCPCSLHPPWKCPTKREEKKEPSVTACASAGSNLNTLGGYLGGEVKKIPSAKAQSRSKDRDTVLISHQLTLLANKNTALSSAAYGSKHQLTIDSACPTSLVGAKYFRSIYQSYPESISSQFQAEPSNKTFQFGGGETTISLGKYTFPILFMDESNELHYLFLAMEVVEQDIIMLLGANSLTKAGALLDCGNLTLTLPTMFGTDIKFPMNYAASGHFTLDFYNLAKEDGYEAAQVFLANESWTKDSASKLLNYVHFNKPQFREVAKSVYLTKRNKNARNNSKTPLTQASVNKLHQLFGHAHPDKLETLIKTSGRWDDKVKDMLKKLHNCEVCKIEGRRVPKPNVALPRAFKHNHVVSVDLKENRRYPQSMPYILYLVDCFSRFKQAVFIPNKRAETVTEAILTNWVKLFGPMRYLHCDRGKEWLNDCLQTFCFKFDIRLTATAALSPNQNSICERGHAVVDRMMDKMITADPTLSPEIALSWSVQACNTLELREGISPHMIVFGHNPVHPTLADYRPGNEENTPEVSRQVSDHIRAMLKAREEFCALESDRVLRAALKQRLYTKCDNVQGGDWIYFRQNNSTVWKGPVKVTSRDGKKIFVLNGGRLNTINLDDILLCKSDDEMWLQSEEQFVTAPKPANVQIDIANSVQTEVDLPTAPTTPATNVGQELETFTFSTAPPAVPDNQLITNGDTVRAQNEVIEERTETVEEVTEERTETNELVTPDIETVQAHQQLQQLQQPYPNKQQPYRVTCNACSKDLSSRSIQVHAKKKHGLRGSNTNLYMRGLQVLLVAE